MGSDHRSVKTIVTIQKCAKQKKSKHGPMKGWKPKFNTDGDAILYQDALNGKGNEISHNDSTTLSRYYTRQRRLTVYDQ